MTAGAPRAGLLALGDSITNGHGNQVLGVHCQSWAQWLAQTLELPFSGLASDGAVAEDVRTGQLPRAYGSFAVGAVYAGVNDVRSVTFDADTFARTIDVLLAGVAARCERVVTCTIPLDLGRPRAGAKVADANAIIRAGASSHGAVVASLEDLGGWTLVQPDAVHPTAVGQLEIADRAARALGCPLPSAGVDIPRTPRSLTRFASTVWLPAVARDRRRRTVEDLRRRRQR